MLIVFRGRSPTHPPTTPTHPNNPPTHPPTHSGTTFREEWERDFHYTYATDPLAAKASLHSNRLDLLYLSISILTVYSTTHRQLFPEGHVHAGCFDIFKMVYEELTAEVLRVKPTHILIGK